MGRDVPFITGEGDASFPSHVLAGIPFLRNCVRPPVAVAVFPSLCLLASCLRRELSECEAGVAWRLCSERGGNDADSLTD